MDQDRNILEVDSLKKHFPYRQGILKSSRKKVYAVDGVSFNLRRGETLGVVGESGCGKSTLGRTILHLNNPTSGRVVFDGTNLEKITGTQLRKLRQRMQIIFQDPFSSLNPRMKIAQILGEPFYIHKLVSGEEKIRRKLVDLLEMVELPSDVLGRYPHEFSGGQRQRISIARALALNPDFIVADEPVSALDVSVQSAILNLLMDLKDKLGLSYLFISHDMAVIEHISDNIAVMYLGRIVEYTNANELYEAPLHPYTTALLEAIPRIDVEKIQDSKGNHKAPGVHEVPSALNRPEGCHFHPRCPYCTDRCRKEVPILENTGNAKTPHLVACFNVSQ